ncbi:MAG: ASCH domain-containing protein, partial [Desulfurellales bacterium]
MKALSIIQPWASLIIWGGKDIENRTWRLPSSMRGQTIYVHASKGGFTKYDRVSEERLNPGMKFPLGAIIGTVEIVDCVTSSDSEWFNGPYGFLLRNPQPLRYPI